MNACSAPAHAVQPALLGLLMVQLGKTLRAAANWAVALALGFAAGAAMADTASTPVPLSYFGLHAHRLVVPNPKLPTDRQLSPWPSFGFGSLRLWDAYVAWPNLQPARDRWDFSTLDRYVELAEQRGVSLLLPLALSPAWASARPDEASNYRPGNAAEPANMDDWRRYVRTVAERYRGRIRLYEVWNEINLKGFYSGSLTDMVEMARIAHEEIKRIDPGAQLVTPSITEAKGTEWLDRYLALGGGRYADVVGYHFYIPRQSPEALVPFVQSVKSIMDKHGAGNKPLWNTESGWWIANQADTERIGAAGKDWKKLEPSQAAAYVARALILGWASGLERYYWYAWDNVDLGLYEPAAREEKPAARAYARVVSWMSGRTLKGCDVASSVWTCELTRANAKANHIAWRESGAPESWAAPKTWRSNSTESLDGRTTPFNGSVMLGAEPLLFN